MLGRSVTLVGAGLASTRSQLCEGRQTGYRALHKLEVVWLKAVVKAYCTYLLIL